MKIPFFVLSVSTLALLPSRLPADDRVILAAMRLAEQPNYSWSVSVADDARSYTIEGRMERGGLTWVQLPMVKSLAQRLGRFADPDVEAVFDGRGAVVIRTDEGWKALHELPKRHREWRDTVAWAPQPGPSISFHDPLGPPVVMLHHPVPDSSEPYCNAQFALSLPHDELAVIVSSYTDLKVTGDSAVGVLTDLGAQLLLVRDGQKHISPAAAAGSFKLELQNGFVTKYQLRLEGILHVGREQVHVRQMSSTVVKQIGSTSVGVPPEARQKLLPTMNVVADAARR